MTTLISKPVVGPVKGAAIFQHWIHSREEDIDDIEVYRPRGFPFPPAFGRDSFELRATGEFIQHDIAPTDGTVAVRGHWAAIGRRRIAVSFPPSTMRAGFTLAVVALDNAVLRIRRLTRQTPSEVPAPDAAQLAAHQALPPPTSFRLIGYDRAEVLTLRSNPPTYVLQVSGLKPFAKMTVKLVPLVYVRQPEYWEIEVVGGLHGTAIPAKRPYTVSLPLGGSLGSHGIQVIGANRSDQFDVPPGQTPIDQ